VGRDVFRGFLSRRSEAMNRIISGLCARLRRSTDVIEDAAFLNVASRLAKQVMSLVQDLSPRWPRWRPCPAHRVNSRTGN